MRLDEALEIVAAGGPTLDVSDIKALRVIIRFAIDHMTCGGLWCDTCGGDGELDWDDSNAVKPDAFGVESCPSCGGTGLDPERLERALQVGALPHEVRATLRHNWTEEGIDQIERQVVVAAITEYLREDESG